MAIPASMWLHQFSARLAPEGEAVADAGGPASRPEGRLIWIHCPAEGTGATVAEVMRAIWERDPDTVLLLTRASPIDPAIVAADPDVAYFTLTPPRDSNQAARAFLETWRPDSCLFFATDPLLTHMAVAHERQIPVCLYGDGAIEDSLRGPALRGMAARAAMRCITHVYARNARWANSYRRLGLESPRLSVIGPLLQGNVVLPCDETKREVTARALGGRPIWLAADVGPDELEIVLEAHAHAARMAHRLLLLLNPANPADAPGFFKLLGECGWNAALYADTPAPGAETQVLITEPSVDAGLWFCLAPVCFMGGGFAGVSGRDPFVPAALGSAIMHGPHMGVHADRYQSLKSGEACHFVAEPGALGATLSRLLAPEVAAETARNAWEIATRGAEATMALADAVLAAAGLPEVG